ncbi:MAG: hypothetical protein QMB37_01590, partial [Paludibacteraceae bacterium]
RTIILWHECRLKFNEVLLKTFFIFPNKKVSNAYGSANSGNIKSENQDKRWYELSDFRKINGILARGELIYQKKISASKTKQYLCKKHQPKVNNL